MILDSVENFLKYAHKNQNSILAYDFIMNDRKNPMPPGRYALDGDRCFATVQTYDTGFASEKDYEAHRVYADVQYIAEGEEQMFWAPSETLENTVPYSSEKDVAFFTGNDENSRSFAVRAGEFAVFYPQDAHKPGCCVDGKPAAVRKIVIKIMLD